MSSSALSPISDNREIDKAGFTSGNFISRTSDARRLMRECAGDLNSESWFERHDGPTLLVAVAVYTGWLALLASHSHIPWWVTAPLAGYVVQWHFSLQHEAIHSMRGIPRWLRHALVWPPIGIWFPFELYRRSHAQHHRDSHLTYPGEDTESYYHEEEEWEDYGDLSTRVADRQSDLPGAPFDRTDPADASAIYQRGRQNPCGRYRQSRYMAPPPHRGHRDPADRD